MMIKPKILAFAGSTSVESFNKKLVKIAVAGAQEGLKMFEASFDKIMAALNNICRC